MWEAQVDSEAGAPQMWPGGSGTGQPHGANPPSPSVLLLVAAIWDLASAQGKNVAICHLVEVLSAHVPLFQGPRAGIGLC